MQGYRAYIIGQDGHIRNRIDLTCQNEAEAKRLALELVNPYDVELWHLGRKVETFRRVLRVIH